MKKGSKIINKLLKEFFRNIHKMEKFIHFSIRYKTILAAMKTLNIADIHPYMYKKWSFGVAFFTGTYKDQKVFIKVDTKLHLLENELHAREQLQNHLDKYLIDIYEFYKDEQLQFAVFPFLENMVELNKEAIINNPNYLDEIEFILKTMYESNIIHRDIKLDNFLLVDNKLKIIDFVFATSCDGNGKLRELDFNRDEDLEILKRLGPYRPASFIENFEWNDFISIKEVVQEILSNSNLPLQSRIKIERYIKMFDQLAINKTYSYQKQKVYNSFKSTV